MSVSRLFLANRSDSSVWLVYSTAAIVSLLLSLWLASQQHVINSDAICYLQSAEAWQKQGLHAALALCDQSRWPFYAILIAGLSHIAAITYEQSAFCLNSLF